MTDKHYTQPEVAAACIARLVRYGDIQKGDRVLDPCVGTGAFADAVKSLGVASNVRTIDTDASVAADIYDDFLGVIIQGDKFQLVVSNPPFSLAREFVERAVAFCDPRGTVAFLLLLQFLGSTKRSGFFREFPPSTVDILRPRPSFAENGSTDMREYALFRWLPQDFECLRNRGPQVGFIDWTRESRRPSKAVAEVSL